MPQYRLRRFMLRDFWSRGAMPTPSPLRFRAPNNLSPRSASQRIPRTPRTPKSPYGVYTGSRVAPVEKPVTKRNPIKLLFFVLIVAFLLSLVFFRNRHALLPAPAPLRSTQYWSSRSAAHQQQHSGLHANTHSRHQQLIPGLEVEVKRQFFDSPAFQQTNPASEKAWLSLFPKGDNRVTITNPRSHNLPSSARAHDVHGHELASVEVFEVAVVNQLECLNFIRGVLVDYDREHHPSPKDRDFLWHCVDHLRQALLCAADTTLEPTPNLGASQQQLHQHAGHHAVRDALSREGFEKAQHTCKNWTAVRNWIEEKRLR